MIIWLITVGEPLPTDSSASRLYRTGMLAELLAEMGHEVVWWTSAYDHIHKKHRYNSDKIVNYKVGLRIVCLEALGYKKNISLRRILDHVKIARHFNAIVKTFDKPNIIISSFPTIELSYAAVRYGKRYDVPVIVDVRDLWPDIFLDVVPAWARGVFRAIFYKWFKQTELTFSKCYAIFAVSKGYLSWGISRAKRNLGVNDRVYPLAYPSQTSIKKDDDKIRIFFRQLGVDVGKKVILFAGTFGRTYDLSGAITTAKYFRDNGIDNLQFVFCGDGEYKYKWQQQAEGYENIIFTGWLEKEHLQYLLSIAYIGLAAYAKGAPQGIPNKIIEYMSVGLPIISSLQGEAQELLEESKSGFYYDPVRPDSLLACVNKLMDEKSRDNMSKNSKDVYNKLFRAETLYKEMASHIVSMAAQY